VDNRTKIFEVIGKIIKAMAHKNLKQ